LNASAPASARYEVINAGVEETGLDGYYHMLRALQPTLEPDLVLVGIVLNDIQRYGDLEHPPRVAPRTGLPRRVHGMLLRHSQLHFAGVRGAYAVLYRFKVLDISNLFGSPFRPLQAPNASLTRAWDSSLDVLGRLVALTRAQGVPLALVVFPLE